LTSVHTALSSLSDAIDRNRNSNPFFLNVINKIRSSINAFVNLLQDAISQGSATRSVPQIGWLGVVAIIGLAVAVFASYRAALLAVVGFVLLGMLGLWQESMDTLALTLAAVVLSLLIGIPLGVLAGVFPKFEKILTPFLDFAPNTGHTLLLDRACIGNDRHAHLCDPTGSAHHSRCDPRSSVEHRRGFDLDGFDALAGP
jgi:glycine betaine/proline transport system permease protein